MGKYGMVDDVLNDILQAITPLREDWDVRFEIVKDLRAVAASVASLRGATVEPFGSFVSKLFTRWGDLDISIDLSNGLHISSAGKKHKQTLLGDLLRVLRMRGGWNNLQFKSSARVPILKLKSYPQGISCDISINNLQGLMKSKILLWISKIDRRFHDMVLLVKEWAKAHKINNSKAGTFNSYSLSLLVIFHFQTCAPSILPPLKDIYPGNMVDDLRGVRADAENLIAKTCGDNITQFMSDKSRPKNKKSVAELFVEFLLKFAQMDSWASEIGISPYTAQWEQIKNNMRWLPKTYAIFVEDPFEQPQNSARSVSSGQLAKIARAFLETYSVLTTKNATQSSLLTYLVPPHVSRVIAKPAIPNYGGGYHHLLQPQVPRAMMLQPPPQHPRRVRSGSRGHSSKGPTSRGLMPMVQHGSKGSSSDGLISKGPMPKVQHGSRGSSSDGLISKGPMPKVQHGSRGSSSDGLISKGPLPLVQHQTQQIWKAKIQ